MPYKITPTIQMPAEDMSRGPDCLPRHRIPYFYWCPPLAPGPFIMRRYRMSMDKLIDIQYFKKKYHPDDP